MAKLPKLTVVPAMWSAAAAEHLASAMAGDELYGIEGLRSDVETWHCALWAVLGDGLAVAHVVTRFDNFRGGCELCIVAAGGALPHVDLTRSVLPFFEELAAKAGCRSARIHTRRPGMAAKLESMGWGSNHRVFRKEL